MDAKLSPIIDLADAVETGGLASLLGALPRMIGPNSPDAGCISETDACMDGAVGDEEYWGCALGMAACLRKLELDPEIVIPPPPPEDEPPGDQPPPDQKPDLATVILAALLFQLRRKATSYGKPTA